MQRVLRYFLVLFLILVHGTSFSQKEANVWYFGKEIGLDFNELPPTLLLDGKITFDRSFSHMESAASIADSNGQLLFYTNGITVWNRIHEVMLNGTGLFGDNTTTQTLIVPKPSNNKLFYIFTASPEGDHPFFPVERRGFRYSVVDLSKDGGMGEVTEKNILLSLSTTEKIAATKHVNGKDVWVLMHEWGNDVFRSYLITGDGINPVAIYSMSGSVHMGLSKEDGGNAFGQMKISSNGERLALTVYRDQIFEIFQFCSVSGKVGFIGSISLYPDAGGLYGAEFSPSGRYLYVTNYGCNIYQIDLERELKKEMISVITDSPPCRILSQLQLAPDGKIYVAHYQSQRIGVIHEPEKPGEECGYESNAIEIPTGDQKWCMQGLPNFISSYFYNPELYPPRPYFDMPNVFTPNDDGYNDRFVPMVNYNLASCKLVIYNRWGQPVYETMDIENGWNGGEYTPGVYYWIAQFRGVNGKDYTMKGFVQLIR